MAQAHSGGWRLDRSEIIPAIAAAALAAAAIVHAIRRLSALSGRYSQYDFATYYRWGSQYRSGIEWWARTHCNYSPFFVTAFAPLTHCLDAASAHLAWQLLQLACIAAAMVVMARRVAGWSTIAAVILGCAAILSRSSDEVLFFGQFAPLLLLLLAASWTADRSDRDIFAGLFLALAVLLKLYPGTVGGYYLLRGKWRAIAWTALFVAAGVLLTGIANWRGFILYGVPRSTDYLAQGGFWRDRISVLNLVWRVAAVFTKPSFREVSLLTFAVDAILIAAAAYETWAGDRLADGVHFAIWAAFGILLSPLSWHHEMPLLFPLYLFGALELYRLIQGARRQGWRELAWTAVAGAILAGVIGREYASFLKSLIPTFIVPMLALVAALMLADEGRRSRATRGDVSRTV